LWIITANIGAANFWIIYLICSFTLSRIELNSLEVACGNVTSGFRIQALMPHYLWLLLSSWPFDNPQSTASVGNSDLTGLCLHLTGHWRLFSLFSQVLTSRAGQQKRVNIATSSSWRRIAISRSAVICHVLRPLGPLGPLLGPCGWALFAAI